MKIHFLALTILLACQHTIHAIPLKEALDRKLIQFHAQSAVSKKDDLSSRHTGKCLEIHVINKTATAIYIDIEPGFIFQNSNDANQDLICCERMPMHLSGSDSGIVLVRALCASKHKATPNDTDRYTQLRKGSADLIALCQYLSAHKLADNTAQQSVWCLTDAASTSNILDTHTDINVEDSLLNIVCKSRGEAVPQRPHQTRRILRYAAEVEGKYAVQLANQRITLGIYITDTLNNPVITILADETSQPGTGTLKYTYGYRGLLPQGTYLLQAKVNGSWLREKEIVIHPQHESVRH